MSRRRVLEGAGSRLLLLDDQQHFPSIVGSFIPSLYNMGSTRYVFPPMLAEVLVCLTTADAPPSAKVNTGTFNWATARFDRSSLAKYSKRPACYQGDNRRDWYMLCIPKNRRSKKEAQGMDANSKLIAVRSVASR